MELSAFEPAFDNLNYQKLEITDENKLLTTEICGQVPTNYSEQTTDSEYTLVYADGQLIEVFDLNREKVVFRNFTNRFIDFYKKVPKLDPKIRLPSSTKINASAQLLTDIVLAPHTDNNPSYYLVEKSMPKKVKVPTQVYKSRFQLEQELNNPQEFIPIFEDWVLESSNGFYYLNAFKVKDDMYRLLVLLNKYGIKFTYLR